MFRLLWKKKALIVFLVVLVVLLPQAVSRPAQMLSKTILTEITIDKAGGIYTLTGKEVETIPGQTAEHRNKTLVASGASIGDAINKIRFLPLQKINRMIFSRFQLFGNLLKCHKLLIFNYFYIIFPLTQPLL